MATSSAQVGIFRKSGSFVRLIEDVKPTRKGEPRLLLVARVDTNKKMLISPTAFDTDGSNWDEDTQEKMRALQASEASRPSASDADPGLSKL